MWKGGVTRVSNKTGVKESKAVPEKLIVDPIVEKVIRKRLKKPEGKLSESDLEKVKDFALLFAPLKDVGLTDVAKLKQLTSLTLRNTEITDASLKEVAKFKQLKYLTLFDTKVTKAGVAQLQKALPKCQIGPQRQEVK